MAATPAGSPAWTEAPPRDLTLSDVAGPVLRSWRLVAALALGLAVVFGVLLAFSGKQYTARTTFTPEAPGGSDLSASLGGLMGIAGQLGLGTSPGGTVSPAFFVSLVGSRELLYDLLRTEFPDSAAGGRARPLIEILGVEGDTPAERLQRGARRVRKLVSANSDQATGVVGIEVRMPTPELAAAVANEVVNLLNRFNLERRQSQSRAQREFTGARLEEAERALRRAEQAQAEFLERNRSFMQAPSLAAQAARHTREVQVKQELYLTLVKAHEEARIAEVRDTPVLTVIDRAIPPTRPSAPRPVLGAFVGLALGGLVGVVVAYVRAARDRRRAEHRPVPVA